MFTGIIETRGSIKSIERDGEAARVAIHCPNLDLSDVGLGDSIAVSGPCLTVVALHDEAFEVDVSVETLERTKLGNLGAGSTVNLEKALTLSDRLGGHLVTGHVDGLGHMIATEAAGEYQRFTIEIEQALKKYVATKGSISIDGVSLTVNSVSDNRFDLMLIPHTLEITTLGELGPGDPVNIEVDLVARYIERLHGAAE
ncbi:MAG: riboflavin synthase [Pseudomonadota bacterium]